MLSFRGIYLKINNKSNTFFNGPSLGFVEITVALPQSFPRKILFYFSRISPGPPFSPPQSEAAFRGN